MEIKVGQLFRGNTDVVYIVDGFFNMGQQVAHSDYLTGEKLGSPKGHFEDPSLFRHLPSCTRLHRTNPFSKITDDLYPIFSVYHAEVFIAALKEYYPDTPFAEDTDKKMIELLGAFSAPQSGFEELKNTNFPVFIKSSLEIVFDEPNNPNDAGKTFLYVSFYGSLRQMERLVEITKRQAVLMPVMMSQINTLF